MSHKHESTRSSGINILHHLISNLLAEEVFDNQWKFILDAVFNQAAHEKAYHLKIQQHECAGTIIQKLKEHHLNQFYADYIKKFDTISPLSKRIAANISMCLVSCKTDFFISKIDEIFPLLMLAMVSKPIAPSTDGKFVLLDSKPLRKKLKVTDMGLDLQVFESLSAFVHIYGKLPNLFSDSKNYEYVKQLTTTCSGLLLHDMIKLRLKASDFIELVFKNTNQEKLSKALQNNDNNTLVPFYSVQDDLQQLVMNICERLPQCNELEEDFIEQQIRILLLIASVLSLIDSSESNNSDKSVDLNWLCRQVRKLINISSAEQTINNLLVSLITIYDNNTRILLFFF